MKRLLLTVTASIALAASARTIADFFVSAPMYEAAPGLDVNMRMDLLDYFRSNLPSKTKNIYDENAAVIAETDRTLTLMAGDSIQMQYGLAVSGADSVLVVIETLPTPMPDSKVSLYTTDWTPLARQPQVSAALSDWLSGEGRISQNRLEEILPFITAEAEFIEDGNRLVLRHTMAGYFSEKDSLAAEVDRCLKPQLEYTFDGKTFRLQNR